MLYPKYLIKFGYKMTYFDEFNLLNYPQIPIESEFIICKDGMLILWDQYTCVIMSINLYIGK